MPPSQGPLEKVELELPGNAHHELVVYPVTPDSQVARRERVPRYTRLLDWLFSGQVSVTGTPRRPQTPRVSSVATLFA